MSQPRLWDYDPLTGERTYWIHDPIEDTVTLRRVVDVAPILEQNTALHAMTDENERWGEWTRVASIPLQLLDQWIAEGIMGRNDHGGWTFKDNREALRRLDDNDFKKLRTRPGSLSR